MSKVIMNEITKKYGDTVAVKGINLTIDDGKFAVLVGPSGCGKTTTLRMVAGLEDITQGDIYIDDVLINELPPRLRDVAMVFQNYSLYTHMSVRDNLAFGLKARGVPREEIGGKVTDIAHMLHISHLLNRRPLQLSGGERQRVAIGRALVREPKVYLLDEPLSNLDAKLRLEMRSEIKRIHQRLGTTTIYVTHDQAEAMSMSDQLIVINEGEVMQEGSPLDIYDHPDNMFVAQFIGNPAMNLIGGYLVAENEKLLFNNEYIKFAVSHQMEGGIKENNISLQDEIFLGIRPEVIKVGPQDNDHIILNGEVIVVEPLGAETLILVRVGNHEIRLKVEAKIPVYCNQTLPITFPHNRVCLFHGPSGRAITCKPERIQVSCQT